MGEVVSREEQLRAAWYEAHQELRTFLDPLTWIEKSRATATAAISLWVRRAVDGYTAPVGPYGLLYGEAFALANTLPGFSDVPDVAALYAQIPLNRSLLPYQLSKIYTDIWRAGQLLHWDRKTANRATRALSLVWPTSPRDWSLLGPDEVNPLAIPLARRAVDVLGEHTCVDCTICTEAALRWEDADRVTEAWLTNVRLKREEEACPTEERSPSQ